MSSYSFASRSPNTPLAACAPALQRCGPRPIRSATCSSAVTSAAARPSSLKWGSVTHHAVVGVVLFEPPLGLPDHAAGSKRALMVCSRCRRSACRAPVSAGSPAMSGCRPSGAARAAPLLHVCIALVAEWTALKGLAVVDPDEGYWA